MENESRFEGKVIGAREPERINIRKHVGTWAQIEHIEEHEGEHGPYILVKTEPVERIKGRDGDIIIRGTKIFNLKKDDEGNVYWHKNGKLDAFLLKNKATTWNELMGKTVQLTPITSKKDGKEYLSFD